MKPSGKLSENFSNFLDRFKDLYSFPKVLQQTPYKIEEIDTKNNKIIIHCHITRTEINITLEDAIGKPEIVKAHMVKDGAIVIDAKGDLELLAKIRMNVQAAGRMKDFLFFSLSNPELSHTYNPLLRGNASQIKDKLIGASEWGDEFYKKKAEEAALTILRPMVELGRKPKFRDLYYLLTDSDILR